MPGALALATILTEHLKGEGVSEVSERSFKEDEELKRIEQERDHRFQREREAHQAYADHNAAERLSAMEAIREYGQATVRTLALLNGGAILALLTFTGSFFTRNDRILADVGVTFARSVADPFCYFGAGLVCGAIVAGIGYVNYSVVAASYYDPGEMYDWLRGTTPKPKPRWYGPFAVGSAWVAVAIATTGLIAFVAGSIKALRALSVLGA